jgi:hypothetical protein
MVGGNNTFTLTGSFTCLSVSEVQIIVPNTVTSTIAFGTAGTDPGCSYSGSGKAVECKAGGTVTDVTGTLNNLGSGYGAYNSGTWTDFSGTLINSGRGTGALNAATWTAFSGTLIVASQNGTLVSGDAIPISGAILSRAIASQVDA